VLPYEVVFLIAGLMLGAIGLFLLPRGCELDGCDCQKVHQNSRIRRIAVGIEKQHITFHDALRPQPACPLCQATRREPPADDES
jgi:uncharacterized membrane protein YdjX (TVP38/TMEM64 family)